MVRAKCPDWGRKVMMLEKQPGPGGVRSLDYDENALVGF